MLRTSPLSTLTAFFLLCASPSFAANVQKNWVNLYGDGNFPTQSNTINVGSTNANTACGTRTTGDFMIAVLEVYDGAGGGDPGAITPPAGWTQLQQLFNSDGLTRAAVFKHTVTTSETCSYTFTWTDSVATHSGGLSWALMDFGYTGGTPPGSFEDNTAQHDEFTGSNNSFVAPANVPTNSNDLMLDIWTTPNGNSIGLTPPGGQTTIVDTPANGGAFFSGTIVVATELLAASGSTGTRTGTGSSGFVHQSNFSVTLNQPTGGGAAAAKLPVYVNSIP